MSEPIDIDSINQVIARWVGFHPERIVVRFGLYDADSNPVDHKVYNREEDAWQSCPRFDRDPASSAALREFLRQKGFLVELKVMPDGFPFRRNDEDGSDLTSHRAWCKLYPMAPVVQWYRNCPLHSFGDSEAIAVLLAAYAVIQHYRDARTRLIKFAGYPVARDARTRLVKFPGDPVAHEQQFEEAMGLKPLLREGLPFQFDFNGGAEREQTT